MQGIHYDIFGSAFTDFGANMLDALHQAPKQAMRIVLNTLVHGSFTITTAEDTGDVFVTNFTEREALDASEGEPSQQVVRELAVDFDNASKEE